MKTLTHKFVEFIPEIIQEDTIYISIEYSTALHKCCCGCGNEVVTPFSPTDWKLIFDGESITLNPSIGNWNFNCRSHYFIRNNKVKWAESWSNEEVKKGRSLDRMSKKAHFEQIERPVKTNSVESDKPRKGKFWSWLMGK